jgi:hypothetical protein
MNKRHQKLLADAGLGIKHDGIVLVKSGVTGAQALEQFTKLLVKDTKLKFFNRKGKK